MDPAIKSQNYSVIAAEAFQLVVPMDCAGQRLDQALARLLPEFSRSRLAQWIRSRNIELDGRPVQPKIKVWGGEKVRVVTSVVAPERVEGDRTIELDRVYEDAHILVINKPAGLVVHPGNGNRNATLMNALLGYAPQLNALPRAGIVHRLDKETSGLLVVAKTLVAQTDLVRQLQARSVKREYLAVAHGRIEADGKIDAPIGRHPTQRTRMAVVSRGKPAVTYYRVIRRYAHATSLCCRLETGRTHQIRVHLQKMGHALVGDPVYGKSRNSADPAAASFKRQALHAQRLALRHPASGEIVSWSAPTPSDIAQLLATLEAER